MWARGDLRPPSRSPGDDDWSSRVPRKRFRHARRYYRKLERWTDEYRIDAAGWYDMWHTHPDWRGDGNRSGRDHRRHLAAGFTVLRTLLRQASESGRPMQAFMTIDPMNSAFDAVHVHTPNPNRDSYPFGFPDVTWDIPAPAILRDFLTEPEWQLGRRGERPVMYYVRPRPE